MKLRKLYTIIHRGEKLDIWIYYYRKNCFMEYLHDLIHAGEYEIGIT